MPVLQFDTTPKRFILPSTADGSPDQAWVEMTTYPLCADDYNNYYSKLFDTPDGKEVPDSQKPSLNAEVLARRIKNWNYTDATGAALPITAESIGHLKNADQLFLANCIEAADTGGEETDKKKETSSATSSQPPTATP